MYPIKQFLNGRCYFLKFLVWVLNYLIFFFKEKHTAFNCNQYKKLGVIDYWWLIRLVAEAPNWVTMHSTSVPYLLVSILND